MSEVELLVLLIAALATSALTAVAGAGGGLILLIVLLQFVDPLVAIPTHAMIQLASNGTRAVTLRHEVDRVVLGPYVVPLLPAAAIGFLIADAVPDATLELILGAFALAAVWLKAATAWLAPRPGAGPRFAVVGLVAGVTNPIVGAPGPLLAPAFRAATASHAAFVATFAVGQVLNHTAKVVVFAVGGYAWGEYLPAVVVGIIGVVVGTRLGTRWMTRIAPDAIDIVFKTAVTAGAGRLVLGALGWA